MAVLLVAQAVAVLCTCIIACIRAVLALPLILVKQILFVVEDDRSSCTYYEGHVFHKRKAPIQHQFRFC